MRPRAVISIAAAAAAALVAGAALVGCGGSTPAKASEDAAPASAAPATGTVLIRHQAEGCHAWSVNGSPFDRSQTVDLARGGALVVTNNDIMPHELIQTAGPAVQFVGVPTPMSGDTAGLEGTFGPATMAHMGATTKVIFPGAGTYRFTTEFGEDYPGMMSGDEAEEDESGEDNVLELTVDVA